MYEMKKPISWAKFKSYPKDIQEEYLQWLVDEFGVSVGKVVSLFKISASLFYAYRVDAKLDVRFPRSMTNQNQRKFQEWLNSFNVQPEESKKEKVKSVEQPVFFNTIASCEMSMEGRASEIAQTLFSLFKDQKIAISVVFAGAAAEEKQDVEV